MTSHLNQLLWETRALAICRWPQHQESREPAIAELGDYLVGWYRLDVGTAVTEFPATLMERFSLSEQSFVAAYLRVGGTPYGMGPATSSIKALQHHLAHLCIVNIRASVCEIVGQSPLNLCASVRSICFLTVFRELLRLLPIASSLEAPHRESAP
ncbi:MAG: hypothetical protein U0031_23490 [Thermomicrobiales bacterium]